MNLLIFILSYASHMQIKNPTPRKSKYNTYYLNLDDVDYNLASPIGNKVQFLFFILQDKQEYPLFCRGAPKGPIVAS